MPLVNEGKHKKIRSSTVEQLLFSASGAYLSGILATGNFCTANSNACSTGTESILMGFEHIRQGKAIRMVVGSTEGYSPFYWAVFDSLRVTATQFNDAPGSASRPMSATACGLVPGAGAGILVLEELESALRRNTKIYAEIAGGHLNSGGQRNGGTMTSPNPDGVIACITNAIKDANISSNDIDCISGHLSSTMADAIEIRNWTKALQRYKNDFPYINSLKSMTGHCLGAAGTIEIIAATLEISKQFLHPSINCEDVHSEIASLINTDKIPHTVKDNVEINLLAKASFGFGDVNACLILKKHK
ncbi:MAG: beta-ketoacyl synthase N-terminal-like domain-containing protein [Bacteroidota bacterium]